MSDFGHLENADAADRERLNRRGVTIPAVVWERFEAWANAPARRVPALRELAATRLAWQGED